MIMMNSVQFMGRLTANPEVRKVGENQISVCNFRIAIPYHKNGAECVDFYDCTTWRSNADNLAKYCKKGTVVTVVGSIHNENYTTETGEKRFTVRVDAKEVYFGAAPAAPATPAAPAAPAAPVNSEEAE